MAELPVLTIKIFFQPAGNVVHEIGQPPLSTSRAAPEFRTVTCQRPPRAPPPPRRAPHTYIRMFKSVTSMRHLFTISHSMAAFPLRVTPQAATPLRAQTRRRWWTPPGSQTSWRKQQHRRQEEQQAPSVRGNSPASTRGGRRAQPQPSAEVHEPGA